MKVVLLTNEIPPYRVPLYRALAATPDWDFQVFTCVQREVFRQWTVAGELGFSHRRSLSLSYLRHERHRGHAEYEETTQVHLPLGLFFDLWRARPDVIISLELGARSVIASTYARMTGTRLVFYFEGTPHTEREISARQRWLRRLLRRAPQGIACNGTEGRRYLEQLGVPADRILEIGQAVDTESFLSQPSSEQRDATREKLGVSGWCCLFSGQLIPRKGVSQFLDAWAAFCRQSHPQATLLVAGDGPQREMLQRKANDLGLDNVRFLGFVPRDELAGVYHATDAFVLPSLHDCWALVVEEAMAAGLPVIDSKYNGGAAELIVPGETGWICDPLDEADLVEKIRLAWEARDRKDSMGTAARDAVARMSIEEVAGRIRQIVQRVAPELSRRKSKSRTASAAPTSGARPGAAFEEEPSKSLSP